MDPLDDIKATKIRKTAKWGKSHQKKLKTNFKMVEN